MTSAYSVFANGVREPRANLLDALTYARLTARCYGYSTLRINGELVRSFVWSPVDGAVRETCEVSKLG